MKKILIFFLSYQNFLFCQFNPVSLISGQINNRQLDNNLEVGTISGNISVSPTGSATYNIPLELPKGVGDISPKISISYNQQSTNGLLGFGWSVDGLSSIMRTTNSLYYDEYKSSINLDIYDAISLDNQRLLPISGGILSNGSIYGFEIEDYTRVEITTGGINGSSPEIFEVKKDNGIIAQYGGNNSFMQSTSGIKYIWRLNKMYDNSGNYINYVYGNRGPNYTGESYIDYIEYTGNTILGIAPQIKIKFNYGLFTKLPYSYVCGNEVSRELILTSIDIYVSNIKIRV